MDDDLYVMIVIHTDLDIILNDLKTDHFIDIIFGELEIPAEKVSAEQREELVKIVKLSPLVKSTFPLKLL